MTLLIAPLQGTSRGGADLKEIVRRIDLWGLTHLYVVGGNGGNAAANAINQELQNADVVCSVIGVPKSIDNDILLVRFCQKSLHLVMPHVFTYWRLLFLCGISPASCPLFVITPMPCFQLVAFRLQSVH